MLVELILLALASSSVAVTISWSKVFLPLREYLARYTFLSSLVKCGYCLGHWTSLFFYLIVQPTVVHWAADYFIMVGFTSIITLITMILLYLYKFLLEKT